MYKLRITGGKFCGRKVLVPQGSLEIRPAMDRMRESMFSIIGPLEGMSFCDLFSGSGCIGLEAASRGAVLVDLVELDREKKAVMEKNTEWAAGECEIHIYFANVFGFVAGCRKEYNVVYADPPFPMQGKTKLLDLVYRRKTVAPGGRFIIHIPTAEDSQWPEKFGDLTLYRSRRYGRNTVLFYTREMNC